MTIKKVRFIIILSEKASLSEVHACALHTNIGAGAKCITWLAGWLILIWIERAFRRLAYLLKPSATGLRSIFRLIHATDKFLCLLYSGRTLIYDVHGFYNSFISIFEYLYRSNDVSQSTSVRGASRVAQCQLHSCSNFCSKLKMWKKIY